MSAVFIALLIVAMFIPVLNIFANIALPIPFVVYAARYDLKAVGLMFAVTQILALLFGTLVAIPVAVSAAFGGIMIGVALRKKLTPYETWASGTIGFVAGLAFVFVFSQFVFDVNWIDETNELIDRSLSMTEEIVSTVGLNEEASQQMETMKEQFKQLPDYMPAGLAVASIFMAFITQWLSYKVLNRIERKTYRFPPFRSMRLPTSIIWIYFFALIAGLFVQDADSLILLAANNAMMLVGLLLTLQGFSFIFFFAHTKSLSKAIPVVAVVVTLLLPFIMLYIIRLIGIVDIGFGVRERMENREK
nr:YybS family protein [Lentibacillus sp. JNUCC-1]